MQWLILAFISLACYSLWGLINGFAVRTASPHNIMFYSAIGYLIITLFFIFIENKQLVNPFAHLNYSGLWMGAINAIGGICLLTSIRAGGNPTVVIILTAVYPLVTLLLNNLLLGMPFTILHLVGGILSIIGVVIISI